jgi:hypothetical protein
MLGHLLFEDLLQNGLHAVSDAGFHVSLYGLVEL